ncbi:MAG: HYExAFE family protein [Thermoguttaceae bacterium]
MANRKNHYEAAFEAYLRFFRIPYIATREHHRSVLENGESVKNLDFIISFPGRSSFLVDIKGRKFPGGTACSGYWRHWTTYDDLRGMARWEQLFGNHYSGLFVFAYLICGDRSPLPYEELFRFRGREYAFLAVPFFDYLASVRLISPRWKTYAMPLSRFRSLARPLNTLLPDSVSPIIQQKTDRP